MTGDIQLTESQQRVLMTLADAEREDRTPCTGDLVRELGMTAEEVNDAMDVLADFGLADSVREPDQDSDDDPVGYGQTMCDLHTTDGDYCNAPVTVYALYANDDDIAGFAGYCSVQHAAVLLAPTSAAARRLCAKSAAEAAAGVEYTCGCCDAQFNARLAQALVDAYPQPVPVAAMQ